MYIDAGTQQREIFQKKNLVPTRVVATATMSVVVAAKRKDQDGTRKMLSDPEVVAHMQVLHAGPFHTHYFKLQKQGHG